mmetsp:Transcript_4565/g.9592  ORF Transcript_4565/g.9592 Transcript_4565/m.9592 type:complete len:203 (-) Transcript_4565:1324-1932(-)
MNVLGARGRVVVEWALPQRITLAVRRYKTLGSVHLVQPLREPARQPHGRERAHGSHPAPIPAVHAPRVHAATFSPPSRGPAAAGAAGAAASERVQVRISDGARKPAAGPTPPRGRRHLEPTRQLSRQPSVVPGRLSFQRVAPLPVVVRPGGAQTRPRDLEISDVGATRLHPGTAHEEAYHGRHGHQGAGDGATPFTISRTQC